MKKFGVILLLISAIVLPGCKESSVDKQIDEKNKVTEEEISESTIIKDNATDSTDMEDGTETLDTSENTNVDIEKDEYEISANIFQNENIKIIYPIISNCENEDIEQSINESIYEKIVSISNYYDISSNPTMDINYSIKTTDNNIVSIVLEGYGNCDNTAYPTNFFYTINIDLNTGTILKLKDMVNIDEEFINRLKTASTIDNDKIENYFNTLTDGQIIEKLNNADNRYSEVCSYLTDDGYIGVSIQVPHVMGDHLEYEIMK